MKTNNPAALNEQGRRQNQEDSIFPAKDIATTDTRTFIVCDGMGGHSHGEVASAAVCEAFAKALAGVAPETFDEAAFNRALDSAFDTLDARDTSEYGSRMGTTLAFLHLSDREALIAHIGDSRVYHLRTEGGEARIVYRTSDHSLVNELLNAGVITPEEARIHPKRNVITRAMQPREEHRPKADIHRTGDVRAGDWFFLCSDGVLESVEDETLLEIVAASDDAASKIEAIRRFCADGSRDNFSAWLVPIAEGISGTDSLDASTDAATTDPPALATVTDPPISQVPAAKTTASPVRKKKPEHRAPKSRYGWLWIFLLVAAICVAVWFLALRKPTETSEPRATEKPQREQRTPAHPEHKPIQSIQPAEPVTEPEATPAEQPADTLTPGKTIHADREMETKATTAAAAAGKIKETISNPKREKPANSDSVKTSTPSDNSTSQETGTAELDNE